MEWCNLVIGYINKYVIQFLPFSILTLILIQSFVKKAFDFTSVFKLIKWLLIVFSVTLVITELVRHIVNYSSGYYDYYSIPSNYVYLYLVIYWLPLLLGTTLIYFHRLSQNRWYLLFVSSLISIGVFGAIISFVLSMFQTDNIYTGNKLKIDALSTDTLLLIVIQGIVVGTLLFSSSKSLDRFSAH